MSTILDCRLFRPFSNIHSPSLEQELFPLGMMLAFLVPGATLVYLSTNILWAVAYISLSFVFQCALRMKILESASYQTKEFRRYISPSVYPTYEVIASLFIPIIWLAATFAICLHLK